MVKTRQVHTELTDAEIIDLKKATGMDEIKGALQDAVEYRIINSTKVDKVIDVPSQGVTITTKKKVN